MQRRECEQAIRAPMTALRAKELWKTTLTSVKRQTQHLPHHCGVEEEVKERENAPPNPKCNFNKILRSYISPC